MEIPANWQVAGDRYSGMVAPPGGIVAGPNGTENLVYGVLTDVYEPEQQSGDLRDTFDALLLGLLKQNPGLQADRLESVTVGGVAGLMAHAVDRGANGGRGEHDWIVGVPQNGNMRYFVFVAPETDFATMRPTFERVLASIRVE